MVAKCQKVFTKFSKYCNVCIKGGGKMIRPIVQRTQIGQELSEEAMSEWVDCVKEGMLHNVDTLAFTAYTLHDYKLLSTLQSFLEGYRMQAELQEEEVCIEPYNYFIQPFGVGYYNVYLVSKNRYGIFFSKPRTRDTDMPILVRLSSEFLWLHGEVEAVKICIKEIDELLKYFGTSLGEIKLSRVDYAFHTNMIQNMATYYRNIDQFVVSQFRNYQLIFHELPDLPAELATYYHGNRRGKTVFFRSYDKTRETVEKGYKQFFYEIWRERKLISKYDKYVLEKTVLDRNFERHYLYRLSFYLEFGSDEFLKDKCRFYLNPSSKYEFVDLVKCANYLTPPITRIINLEFETGSKFYKSSREFFRSLQDLDNVPEYHQVFYKMICYKTYTIQYLTTKTYRQVSMSGASRKRNRNYNYLWKRVLECDLNAKRVDGKLLRLYQRERDIELLHKQIARKISTASILSKGSNNDDLAVDISDFINSLSENVLHDAEQYKLLKIKDLRNQLEE